MKHLFSMAMIAVLLFSCKKDIQSPAPLLIFNSSFFQTVRSQLKDSLSPNDYANIDTDQLYKSKDAQSDAYFVRGAFRKKDLATDFMLLKTDSLGNIIKGKLFTI